MHQLLNLHQTSVVLIGTKQYRISQDVVRIILADLQCNCNKDLHWSVVNKQGT